MTKTTRTSALAALALSAIAVGSVLGYQALEPAPDRTGSSVADARVSDAVSMNRLERQTGAREDDTVDPDDEVEESEAEPTPEETATEPAQPEPAEPEPAPAAEPPAPAPEPDPAPLSTSEATQTRLHELLNTERASAGLSSLARHPALDAAAQEWACEMVSVGLQHSSSGWRDARLPAGWRMNGENVAVGYSTPERASEGWMQSPGHRDNILRESYTHVGTGWCYSEQAAYGHHWVQIFAQL